MVLKLEGLNKKLIFSLGETHKSPVLWLFKNALYI